MTSTGIVSGKNVPFKVATATVDQDDDEEDRVEVRDGRAGALAETPGQAHDPVGDVVRLARVRPPAVDKQTVAVRSLDVLRVVESTIRQLREGLAVLVDTLSLHLEATLL